MNMRFEKETATPLWQTSATADKLKDSGGMEKKNRKI